MRVRVSMYPLARHMTSRTSVSAPRQASNQPLLNKKRQLRTTERVVEEEAERSVT